MEPVVAVVLFAAALAAGITGAWSPCGFSMVDTLGAAARLRGRRVMRVACATFAVGAVAGGVATFGALALVGGALHAGDSAVAVGAAVAVAAVAAVADAAGWRIAPQIRRQVPEGWRHVMPLPVVGALYGVLLGLGFTTFVLAFAVWALAGISVALGSPPLGVAIGLGFGLGRAVPVIVMAPRLERRGGDMLTAMAERPALLGRLRRLDAALLAVVAVAIGAGAAAGATTPLAGGAIDPSMSGDTQAWRDAEGVLVRWPGREARLAGATTAAVAGPLVVSDGPLPRGRGLIVETRDDLPARADRAPASRPAGTPALAVRAEPGVTAVAADGSWAAWRRDRPGGGDQIMVARLPGLAGARVVAGVGAAGQLSRPALDAGRLVYALNTPRGSSVVLVDLESGVRRVMRRSRTLVQYRDPSLRGDRLLVVLATYCDQRLRVEPLLRPARGVTLARFGTTAVRDRGHSPGRTQVGSFAGRCPAASPPRTGEMLDATALTATDAYVTVSRPGAAGLGSARILRAPLSGADAAALRREARAG